MLKKVLAYSADTTVLETLNTWAAKDHPVDLHATSSPEALEDLLSSDAFNALILDNSDPEVSFSGILQRLVLIPGMKVLLIQPRESEVTENSPDQHSMKVIKKPLTGESLIEALHELIGSGTTPESVSSGEDAIFTDDPNAIEDLSYLKDWIAYDPREEIPVLLLEIEPQPSPSKEPIIESDELISQPATPPESEVPPESQDELTPTVKSQINENAGGSSLPSITPPQVITGSVNNSQPPVDTTQEPTALDDQSDEPAFLDTEFSCVLIPRDPQCYLTRAIAERLGLILPWIHANHNWRLTGISIRPQHLQWSVALPTTTSPVSAIREIRRLSSDQLFATFSELQNREEDQEFWAPGYLVISGTRSAPYTMIKSFMDWTRQSQSRGN